MTHPHDQAPAPLTAEVVAMVAQLRQRAIFAKAENTGTAQGDAWHFDGAADMLTALAAENTTLRDENETLLNNTRIHISDDVARAALNEAMEIVGTLRTSEAALATQLAEEQRIATERGNHIEFVLLPQMADLTTQLDERDAELARVTAQRDALVKIDVARDGEYLDATARIAALTEALKVYADGCDETETSACGYDGNLCCKTARAALTTDKEPTT